MKSYNLHAVDDLRYEEVDLPELQKDWVLVKVMASGICSSDIPRIFKKGTYHFPTIPGHEFSGLIVKTYDEEHQDLLGKRVGVFPLIPCNKCCQCQQGKYEMCENYDYIGSRRDGAFAEYVAVPEWNLIELPDTISYEEAAMLEPLSVALHAVKRAGDIQNCKVGIVGTGMIGFAAAEWAAAYGAKKVYVIGRNSEKKKYLSSNDKIMYINKMEEIKCPECDLVIEAVGSNSSIEMAINMVNSGGRIVLMGNPEGDIHLRQDVYWKILRKQVQIAGTWNSSYEKRARSDWSEAVQALADKRICVSNLISHCLPKSDLRTGLDIMREHKESYCKVMVRWDEDK
ncbi:MAG: galactitol-1-phosphate 5-dehydrogenase [Clostridiales bacterium]|nr:galactitol-1-phosphate 5-dehydrogenase [Clostridiales bacterium]